MNTAEIQTSALPWVIVGLGRMGQALSYWSADLGIEVRAIWNRTKKEGFPELPALPRPLFGPLPQTLFQALQEPALIWLTVADDAIQEIAAQIVDTAAPGSILVHTSGSLGSDIIDAPSTLAVASLHPLQAITTPQEAIQRFPRTFWTLEGDDRAVDFLADLMKLIGVAPLRISPEDKTLYHASAVTAANLLVSLFDAAIAMAEFAHIDSDRARQMLVELAQSSLENLRIHRPAQALTGPVARGDQATIERHRQALLTKAKDDPQLLAIYDLLTQRALARLT